MARRNPTAGTPLTPRPSLPPQRAIEVLNGLIERAHDLESEPFASPQRQEWTDTAEGALERAFPRGSSILTSFGGAQAIAFNIGDTEETLRRTANGTLAAQVSALRSAIQQLGWSVEVEEQDEGPQADAGKLQEIAIFISHSSKDAALAEALIELLKAALALPADQIRCSSVDGYRLPVGVNTESKLREEVRTAAVVIGLITPNSLGSHFVMFELGARWGSNLFLAPLLAGLNPGNLAGPLSLLNALSASSDQQLCQLVEDIAAKLGSRMQNPSAFLRQIAKVKLLADAAQHGSPPAPANPPVHPKLSIAFATQGTPPNQTINVQANQRILVSRLEYMLSSEACVASEDLALEGDALEVPLNQGALTAVLNTSRPDMTPYDLSGPMKIALTVKAGGTTQQFIVPVHLANSLYGNTYYRKLTGSKSFYSSSADS